MDKWNELEGWNTAYGLSKVLLRNMVVGMMILLVILIGYFIHRLTECSTNRVNDMKEFNHRLQKEKETQDSINNVFLIKYFQLKQETSSTNGKNAVK